MTRLISFFIVAILISAYFLFPDFKEQVNEAYQIFTSDDRNRITEYVQQFGLWGPFVIVLTMIVQMFLIVIPSWLLMIVAVLAYGSFWGVLLSVIAVFIASTIGYFIGRSLSEATLNRLIGETNEQKLEDVLHQYGMGAVVIFRLAPFLSNDAISFVAGILKMSYLRFISATLIGIVPLAVLIAYFSEDIETLKSGLIWVGAFSLLGYVGYILYDKYKK